jgi:hypothetical protein
MVSPIVIIIGASDESGSPNSRDRLLLHKYWEGIDEESHIPDHCQVSRTSWTDVEHVKPKLRSAVVAAILQLHLFVVPERIPEGYRSANMSFNKSDDFEIFLWIWRGFGLGLPVLEWAKLIDGQLMGLECCPQFCYRRD